MFGDKNMPPRRGGARSALPTAILQNPAGKAGASIPWGKACRFCPDAVAETLTVDVAVFATPSGDEGNSTSKPFRARVSLTRRAKFSMIFPSVRRMRESHLRPSLMGSNNDSNCQNCCRSRGHPGTATAAAVHPYSEAGVFGEDAMVTSALVSPPVSIPRTPLGRTKITVGRQQYDSLLWLSRGYPYILYLKQLTGEIAAWRAGFQQLPFRDPQLAGEEPRICPMSAWEMPCRRGRRHCSPTGPMAT